MHPHEALIDKFYTAFKRSDAVAMAACYHPDIEFSDPVFPGLRGKRAMAMWAMLNQRIADPDTRTFSSVHADDLRGSAHWEAHYDFPLNGRRVHNVIEATFEFSDGLIRRHTDRFDFWRWSRMAFGLPGILLGWGPLQRPVQKKIGDRLAVFISEHPEFQ